MKMIEIVDTGGIYGYFKEKQCLYVGKTTRDFKERDKEHKNSINKTPFDLFYSNNPELECKPLFECKLCNLTTSQLDYLEKSFINILNPIYNVRRDVDIIEINFNKDNKNVIEAKSLLKTLTKNEILVLNFIKNLAEKEETISRIKIKSNFKNDFSERTLDRIMVNFKEKNILIPDYIDEYNRVIYRLNEELFD